MENRKEKQVEHKEEVKVEKQVEKQIENLEVIEAKELQVGSAFHAFRFNAL